MVIFANLSAGMRTKRKEGGCFPGTSFNSPRIRHKVAVRRIPVRRSRAARPMKTGPWASRETSMASVPFDQLDGHIWMNGEFVKWAEAKIHVLTHGLHYA